MTPDEIRDAGRKLTIFDQSVDHHDILKHARMYAREQERRVVLRNGGGTDFGFGLSKGQAERLLEAAMVAERDHANSLASELRDMGVEIEDPFPEDGE